MDSDLPFVTVIIPTMKSRIPFRGMMIKNLTSQTYPHDKMEVLVVGDDDPLTKKTYEDTHVSLSKMEFRYIPCHISSNIGKKRNFCCSKASHNVIAMMDDDDIYNREYIEHSVTGMESMKKDIVGCRDMIITWPSKDFETRYVRGSSIHEGTMVFRKSHWKKYGFKESRTGEGTQMVSGEFYRDVDIRRVMICVAHDSNTFDKESLLRDGIVVPLSEDKKKNMREIMGVM